VDKPRLPNFSDSSTHAALGQHPERSHGVAMFGMPSLKYSVSKPHGGAARGVEPVAAACPSTGIADASEPRPQPVGSTMVSSSGNLAIAASTAFCRPVAGWTGRLGREGLRCGDDVFSPERGERARIDRDHDVGRMGWVLSVDVRFLR